jgi:hypothetical protein
MGRRAGAATIVLIVLILLSLSLAGAGFYQFQQEKNKSIALQEKLDDLGTKQKISEAKLRESQKSISDLQSKLQDAAVQVDTLSKDLEAEKTSRLEAVSQIEQVKADLDQQKTLRSDLEKRLNLAQDDLKKTQGLLNQLESQKAELDKKLKDLEKKPAEGVELGEIVVSPENTPLVQSDAQAAVDLTPQEKGAVSFASEGKVLVVNKEYNFAVVSLGNKDGIEIGDVFSVYHAGRYIGDIKVEKVHDSMSAAGFVSLDIKDKVSEGDKVVKKG